jgi:hypothetical protein
MAASMMVEAIQYFYWIQLVRLLGQLGWHYFFSLYVVMFIDAFHRVGTDDTSGSKDASGILTRDIRAYLSRRLPFSMDNPI